jgi:hypothetical protein
MSASFIIRSRFSFWTLDIHPVLNIIYVQLSKTCGEEEMSNLSTHVLDMMAARRLDKTTAAQLLDVVWSVDGRDQRVQRWL